MRDQRISLWEDLHNWGSSLNDPWLVDGDFNAPLESSDRLGGNLIHAADILDFNNCIQSCCIEELHHSGCFYTWNNKHEEGPRMFSKIDRMLVNNKCLDLFPYSYYDVKNEGISYRCPLLLTLIPDIPSSKKAFRYVNMWLQHEKFLVIVAEQWRRDVKGSKMFSMVKRLKALKYDMRKLNREKFFEIEKAHYQKRQQLNQIQDDMHKSPGNLLIQETEKKIYHEYLTTSKHLGDFYKQKSKVSWVQSGDQNSRYFHARNLEGTNKELCN